MMVALQSFVTLYLTSLLVSISAADLFASLLILAFLSGWFLNLKNCQTFPWYPIVSGQALLPFLGCFFVAILGFLFVADPEAPALSSLARFSWILWALVLATALRSVTIRPHHLWVLGSVGFLAGIYSLLQVFFEIDFFRNPIEHHTWPTHGRDLWRAEGFVGSPMIFAHSASMVWCFLLSGLIHIHPTKKQWWLVLLATLSLGAGLLLSFTRGIWLALALTSVLIVLMRGKVLGYIATLVLGALLSLWIALSPTLQNRLTSIVDLNSHSNSERILIWKSNLQVFLDHPWLGVGYLENQRRMQEFNEKYGRPNAPEGHAHNQILQFLSGTGIVGTLFFLWGLIQLLWIALTVYRRSKGSWESFLSLGCFGALLTFLLGGLTEANLEVALTRHVFATVVALTLLIHYQQRKGLANETR